MQNIYYLLVIILGIAAIVIMYFQNYKISRFELEKINKSTEFEKERTRLLCENIKLRSELEFNIPKKNTDICDYKFEREAGIDPEKYFWQSDYELTDEVSNDLEYRINCRKMYGVDPRETWNLDRVFVCWLFSRLNMHLKETEHDLFSGTTYEDGKFLGDKINELIEKCRVFIVDLQEHGNEGNVQEICEDFAQICERLWW